MGTAASIAVVHFAPPLPPVVSGDVERADTPDYDPTRVQQVAAPLEADPVHVAPVWTTFFDEAALASFENARKETEEALGAPVDLVFLTPVFEGESGGNAGLIAGRLADHIEEDGVVVPVSVSRMTVAVDGYRFANLDGVGEGDSEFGYIGSSQDPLEIFLDGLDGYDISGADPAGWPEAVSGALDAVEPIGVTRDPDNATSTYDEYAVESHAAAEVEAEAERGPEVLGYPIRSAGWSALVGALAGLGLAWPTHAVTAWWVDRRHRRKAPRTGTGRGRTS